MEDSFFGFRSNLPPKLNIISTEKFEDTATQDVEEEEYDALNDETFGIGAIDGDWEENHEKLSELIDKTKSFSDGEQSSTSLYFSEPLLDCEESQNEIVTKSISQLGLEDDLDDPAIMTVGRTQSFSQSLQNAFGQSPPPPAILGSEFCGSPKTLSIWSNTHFSTPAKDSNIGSILHAVTHNSSISSYQDSPSPLTPIPRDAFLSPHTSKTWTVEELEKDLQSSGHNPPHMMSNSDWPPISTLHYQCKLRTMKINDDSVTDRDITSHDLWDSPYVARNIKDSVETEQNKKDRWISCTPPLPMNMGVRTVDDVEKDILLKPRTLMANDLEKDILNSCSHLSDDLENALIHDPCVLRAADLEKKLIYEPHADRVADRKNSIIHDPCVIGNIDAERGIINNPRVIMVGDLEKDICNPCAPMPNDVEKDICNRHCIKANDVERNIHNSHALMSKDLERNIHNRHSLMASDDERNIHNSLALMTDGVGKNFGNHPAPVAENVERNICSPHVLIADGVGKSICNYPARVTDDVERNIHSPHALVADGVEKDIHSCPALMADGIEKNIHKRFGVIADGVERNIYSPCTLIADHVEMNICNPHALMADGLERSIHNPHNPTADDVEKGINFCTLRADCIEKDIDTCALRIGELEKDTNPCAVRAEALEKDICDRRAFKAVDLEKDICNPSAFKAVVLEKDICNPHAFRAEDLEKDICNPHAFRAEDLEKGICNPRSLMVGNLERDIVRSHHTITPEDQKNIVNPQALRVDDMEKNIWCYNKAIPKGYGNIASYLKSQQRQNFISQIKLPQNHPAAPVQSATMPMTGNTPLSLLGGPRHPVLSNLPMIKTLQGIQNAVPGWQHNAMLRYGQYRWSAPQSGDISLDHLNMNHPYLQLQRQMPKCQSYLRNQSNAYHDTDNKITVPDDEYCGLMTHKEKDWLLKIQMMLLQTDDPYNQDYYYTAYTANKLAKSSKITCNGGSEEPKLLLPERTKPEAKMYVPTHFEGSLGKLQAVSVNFPRKVLGISVSRPLEDEEGRVVTNQCLLKYRRLLLDIEKMYIYLLEIGDKEKHILALPDDAQIPHKETCIKLTNKIFCGLACESAAYDDNFLNIMSIRKGRNLALRSFRLFDPDQQTSFLTALLRHLSMILRKDQNDAILEQNWELLTEAVKLLSFDKIVALGESLDNFAGADDDILTANPAREKNNLMNAFKNKVGTSIICSIMQRAEELYSTTKSFESEIQAVWARIVLHIVDVLCLLPNNCIVSPFVPYSDLLIHFQRFAVDRDKFETLKEKLTVFSH